MNSTSTVTSSVRSPQPPHSLVEKTQPVRARFVAWQDLDDRSFESWRYWQTQSPELQNPFFSPDFFQESLAVRPSSRLAVLEGSDSLLGFWPMDVRGYGARPLAPLVSEINGWIADPELTVNSVELLRQLGITRWAFDCVPVAQSRFGLRGLRQNQFPVIDLTELVQPGVRRHETGKHHEWSQLDRKHRKMSRECGPVDFLWDDRNRHTLEFLINRKRQQYHQTGRQDVFSQPWVAELVHRLFARGDGEFRGLLSSLYVRGRPAAAHFGMLFKGVLAWWFPAYEPSFAKYSPGNLLLKQMLMVASASGVLRIDLGQGDERYKSLFSNRSYQVMEGSVDRYACRRWLQSTWIWARETSERSGVLRAPLQWFRRRGSPPFDR